ncbi:MAG: Tn3 family transposase [Chloroflexota bacterium]|nr:Tn3 family transposase [Chloroflexota bacterium]
MPTMQETAYPRLKTSVTPQDLAAVYTPAPEELALADRLTKGTSSKLGFLVTLKTFQRLGYFVYLADVPSSIIAHIAQAAVLAYTTGDLAGYDQSGTRKRHIQNIREYLQVQVYSAAARSLIVQAIGDAARTKEHLADLINVAIAELIRHRYELPGFTTLLKAAQRVRAAVYRTFYRQIYAALDAEARMRIDALFGVDPTTQRSPWHALKQDAGNPTLTHLKELATRLAWLQTHNGAAHVLAGLPVAKVAHFAAEAATLDAARMAALEPQKRYALAVALVARQTTRTLDDIAEMLIKRMSTLHKGAKEALLLYQTSHMDRTDALVLTLRDLVVAYQAEGSMDQRFAAMQAVLEPQSAEVLQHCDAYLAHAGNNYVPFLWRFYRSHRATLFRILKLITLRSTSQDQSVAQAIQFLLDHEHSTGDWLTVIREEVLPRRIVKTPLLSLSWVPDAWWRLLTHQHHRHPFPERVNRRHFEVCVFSQILSELKSGDLAIVGSEQYADPTAQQISWEEYAAQVADYGREVELPVDGTAFVAHVQSWLTTVARTTDHAFPTNQHVYLEHGRPVIRRPEKKQSPAGLATLERLIDERLEPMSILDVLSDTATWLDWTRFFGPISGHDAKIDNPVERYLITAFCYGCALGPAQTARACSGFDRRQLAWLNQRHITLDNLDQAIQCVIAAYHRCSLPKLWGSAKRAAADGTKWEVYEHNLLSEQHIRYGGYGGIGYYHVADTYIALFSHFIPCGAWEGSFILDIFQHLDAEHRPDVIHGDSQSQSEPIFGLAYLLGVTLMPRIRHWQDLKFYRPQARVTYDHIDDLFTDTINWDLIATHLPDMLRLAMSIKAGRVTPSTILRRLGTYSRKNRLCQAFRELGRAIRTGFLLQYLADAELRSTIQAATNKNESFNHFTKWVAFGSGGVITENDREEQRKLIKYNHLIANVLILHTTVTLSRLLRTLIREGNAIGVESVAALSPYLTKHIDRFGRYTLDLTRQPPEPEYDAPVMPVTA